MTSFSENSIMNLMQSIRTNGLQPTTNYSFIIESPDGTVFDLSTYTLDIVLPGPKYEFYTNTYWRGNWEYKQPAGIKFEDSLICRFMVPLDTFGVNYVGNRNNLFDFLNYNKSKFSYPKIGQKNSFKWLDPATGRGFEGYVIRVTPFNNNGFPIQYYYYINCFLEKVLPFTFSAEAETLYQTMQISFTIGAEMNRL
jgi:hypothetical protein